MDKNEKSWIVTNPDALRDYAGGHVTMLGTENPYDGKVTVRIVQRESASANSASSIPNGCPPAKVPAGRCSSSKRGRNTTGTKPEIVAVLESINLRPVEPSV